LLLPAALACSSATGGNSADVEPEAKVEVPNEPQAEPEPVPEPTKPVCLKRLTLDCAMTFAPKFESIFDNRLRPTCGAAGVSCHGSAGAQAGLVLDDIDQAYDSLLGLDRANNARVIPNDPECSPLMMRLESDDPGTVMPVGSKLPEGERCSIRNWIANGAER
jgi:hypothetical protein